MDLVVAVAAAVQATIVVIAALIAWRQVQEAHALRLEQAQPYVVVHLKETAATRHLVDLVIENLGRTAARHVKIDIDPPPSAAIDTTENRFEKWGPLIDGIDTLVPGQRVTSLFDGMVPRFNSDLPHKYRVQVSYRDDKGRGPYNYEYSLDLDLFFGSHFVDTKGVHDVAKTLGDLQKDVHSWTHHLNGVRVYTVDAERHDREVMEALEEQERILAAAEPASDTVSETRDADPDAP